ncbi:GNAT family N-acetyltransferase [Virgibacillus sp. MG-45]|uniref:GNAT family N-acetyltransferase n=1 Tax=Virgibacillus sp. MG-45 TaxID=3102791 RepID=UPI002ED89FC3
MKIYKIDKGNQPPMELLLLADPNKDYVDWYIDRGSCYVAIENEQIIGVYVLLSTRPGTVELINIAVAEKEQGRGIGRQLVEHAIRCAVEQGYETMEIGTGNSSIGQLALYQKCGFRITGVDRGYFQEKYEAEIIENGIVCRDMIRLSISLAR